MFSSFLLGIPGLLLLFISSSFADIVPFDQWQHQRINLANVSIHLRYHGSGPPLLLVHGWPQHSLTWHTIGPILAQKYTVIAPDNRGCGDSSLPADNDYSAQTASQDLKGILDFLHINNTYIVSHDKGVGLATALAVQYPSLVKRITLLEYPLPGFGYEQAAQPAAGWNLYSNWQLAFFSVPDAAEFFIYGRVREMLAWYFFHASYSGMEAVSETDLTRYTTEISKPGFLRAGLTYFAASFVDEAYFNSTIKVKPLGMPVLGLGGEASLGPFLEGFYRPVGRNVTLDVVPKAGHWIGDENPEWTANRIAQFLALDSGISRVDLGYLRDKVTLL